MGAELMGAALMGAELMGAALMGAELMGAAAPERSACHALG